MYLVAISLVLAQPGLPFQPVSGISGKASGDAHLVCKSAWHNLDVNLTFKGTVGLTAQDLQMFQPPADVKLDDGWTVKDKQLLPLVRLLHGVEWKAAPADAAAFERWRGGLSNQIALQSSGALSLACIKNGSGYRLEFSGRVRALEIRTNGNRLGPNYQQDQWTHEVLGAIIMTGEGVPFGIEIRDTFEVTGRFHNPGNDATDDNRREGTLLIAMPVTAPLPAGGINEIKLLIAQLGDDSFGRRERAMQELLGKGAVIVPYLRQFGVSHPDVETRQRCDWLLRKLLDE